MFLRMLNKIRERFGLIAKIEEDCQTNLLALGKLLVNQQQMMVSDKIQDYEFKIFSQWGCDGIIQFLIHNITITNKIFIEFGVQDFLESNCRFLMMNDNWSGLVMDASEESLNRLKNQRWYWRYDMEIVSVFIDKDNINDLVSSPKYKNIGILSIDIDGNDYHILETIDITKLNPSIIIIEYNSVFGPKRKITIPYDKNFNVTKAHYSNLYFGASLSALTVLAQKLGYSLVGCNSAGNNAFFVRKDLLNERVRELTVDEAYVESKFCTSRDNDGAPSYLRGEDRYNVIKGLPVYDLETNQIVVL